MKQEINLAKYGKNELTPPDKEPLWLTFLKTLTGGFQLLLWAGSILSFAAYIVQSIQMENAPPDNVSHLICTYAFTLQVLGYTQI